jgi:hypothetical protein
MWLVTLLLKPFLTLAFFAVLVVAPKLLFVRYFPDGKVKRFLLRRVN